MNLSKKTLDLIEKNPEIIEKNLKKWVTQALNSKKTLQQRQDEFRLAVKSYVNKYGYDMCKAFYEYWTQKNATGRKMLFEMQKAFEVSKRLAMWHSKEKKPVVFGTPPVQPKNIKSGTNNQEILDEIQRTLQARRQPEA